MNNSVYGKTMEKVRKRCNITIVSSEDNALKHIANPTFDNLIKINDNFIIIKKLKNTVTLNKPSYVGMSVLDYSKLLVYQFPYGVFKKLYGNKVRLLMTDTDSLFYEIKTDDVYKDLFGEDSKFINLFDVSNLKKQTLIIQK